MFGLTQFQAYAEAETDTPGQIFGVTYKTDGKSSNWTTSSSSSSHGRRSTAENISEEFTQGPKSEKYETHDRSGSGEPEIERRRSENLYKMLGALIVFSIASYLYQKSNETRLIELRDQAISEQKARKDRSNEFSDA